MECRARRSWTLSALVGAFLDLAIAYLLLCGSTVAYFTSKFLGFFGLDLPCPCNGLFGIPSNGYCLREFLVDYPNEKISKVQSAVKTTFPFDSVWATVQNFGGTNEVSHNEKHYSEGHVALEGEASSSLMSDARKMHDTIEQESLPKNDVAEFGVMNSPALVDGKFDIKGKKAANQRARSGLRRRRKSTLDYSKLSSIGSHNPFPTIAFHFSMPSCSIEKETMDESSVPNLCSQNDGFNEAEVVPVGIGLHDTVPNGYKSDKAANKSNPENDGASFVEEIKGSVEGAFIGNNRDENTVKFLEQALEKEHAACASLYLELDKERSAAASAADEAMAMISRLQEEKASIEMEARQYKRMIEEKYAYDTEELNFLKEILIRREKEKHFLEKEVEAYRQMITENEQSDGDINDHVHKPGHSASYLREDPLLMLRQINEAIESNEKAHTASNFSEYEVRYVDTHDKEVHIGTKDESIDFSKQWDIQKDTYSDEVFEEKSMVSAVGNPLNEAHTQVGSEAVKDDYEVDRSSEDPRTSTADTKPRVLDVHIIGDASSYNNAINGNTYKRVSIGTSGDINAAIRNNLRTSSRLPPTGVSKGKTLLSDMRGYSMSAVDCERLKIDTEVEWLRERLRTAQESREKLNLSAEHMEQETVQLQLLEDISSQLREIRHFTESGRRTPRQASLPLLLPSKNLSKKRRYRSVPLGVQHST